MNLDDSGRLVGGFCWAESRLFEILGGWVAGTTEPDVKLMLDRHSRHHAWRAGQWQDRLPVLADLDRQALVAPPAPALEASYQALADLPATTGRLAGAYRFALPRLAAAYRGLEEGASPASDGSVRRTLEIVRRDLLDDWLEGESSLQALLVAEPAISDAGGTVTALERLLAG